jgi:hypothetical protein
MGRVRILRQSIWQRVVKEKEVDCVIEIDLARNGSRNNEM